MKKRAISLIGIVLTQVAVGCAGNRSDLVRNGTVTIDEQGFVTDVSVVERDNKTWVSGKVAVIPHTERHLDGMLHLVVRNVFKEVIEHHEICFNSVLMKQNYRASTVEQTPEFEFVLSEKPAQGTTLDFSVELKNAHCMAQHSKPGDATPGDLKN